MLLVMRVGSGISMNLSPAVAADEAVRCALDSAGIERAEGALVFATAAWGGELAGIVRACEQALGTERIAGASVEGLLAAGRGAHHNPAVGVLAFSEVDAEAVFLAEIDGEEVAVGSAFDAHFERVPGPEDALLVFMDSETLRSALLLDAVDGSLDGCLRVGLEASSTARGEALVWGAGEIGSGALAGLRIRGASAFRREVATACSLVGPRLCISRSQGNWIRGLDGRPALRVLDEIVRTLGVEDPRDVMRELVIAVSVEPECDRPSRFVNVVGFDSAREAVAISEPSSTGSWVSFAIVDSAAADLHLAAMLERGAATNSAFGFYLADASGAVPCFGGVDLEAQRIEETRPRVPVLGLHGRGPLVQVGVGPGSFRPMPHSALLLLADR